jgi:hypothetical protein
MAFSLICSRPDPKESAAFRFYSPFDPSPTPHYPRF